MIGLVQERGHSQKGAPKLKIDGKWHFVGRLNADGIEPGMKVEYTASPFGDGGKMSGLQTLKVVQSSSASSGAPKIPTQAPVDEASLRFISNVVGSALTGGQIKEPSQVRVWALAAQDALESLHDEGEEEAEGGGSGEDPGFSDNDIPPW